MFWNSASCRPTPGMARNPVQIRGVGRDVSNSTLLAAAIRGPGRPYWSTGAASSHRTRWRGAPRAGTANEGSAKTRNSRDVVWFLVVFTCAYIQSRVMFNAPNMRRAPPGSACRCPDGVDVERRRGTVLGSPHRRPNTVDARLGRSARAASPVVANPPLGLRSLPDQGVPSRGGRSLLPLPRQAWLAGSNHQAARARASRSRCAVFPQPGRT